MSMEKLPVVDVELALERVSGNTQLARDLYGMLQKELPNYLATIPSVYEDHDYESLLHLVHKLHGSATYCGVPALKAAAESFESSLKKGETDKYPKALESILDAIRQLIEHPRLAI